MTESSCVQNQIAELWKELETKRGLSYQRMNKENKNYLSLKDNEKMIKTLGASSKYCDAAEKLGRDPRDFKRFSWPRITAGRTH